MRPAGLRQLFVDGKVTLRYGSDPLEGDCFYVAGRACPDPTAGANLYIQKAEPKRTRLLLFLTATFGPSGESRTHGLLNPIQARYQTALHPVNRAVSNQLDYYNRLHRECQ